MYMSTFDIKLPNSLKKNTFDIKVNRGSTMLYTLSSFLYVFSKKNAPFSLLRHSNLRSKMNLLYPRVDSREGLTLLRCLL